MPLANRPGCCCTCTATLCVTLHGCAYDGSGIITPGGSVRFQGPNGEDATVYATCDDTEVCYTCPASGDWTITGSHPCCDDNSTVVTVVEGVSQSVDITLDLAYAHVDWSDTYGSATLDLCGACLYTGVYTYTSTSCATLQNCSGGPALVHPNTGTVEVICYVSLLIDCGDLRVAMSRYVAAAYAGVACPPSARICAPLGNGPGVGDFNCYFLAQATDAVTCGTTSPGGTPASFTYVYTRRVNDCLYQVSSDDGTGAAACIAQCTSVDSSELTPPISLLLY